MTSDARFVGFSTRGKKFPPFKEENIDLVRQDLLNEFETRRGERVMRPEYGTIIYDLLMNPFDNETRIQIEEDVERIVNRDPRTNFIDMNMIETKHSIQIQVNMVYVPLRQEDTLYLEYQTNIEDQYV